MKQISLGSTGIRTSKLILGTGNVAKVSSEKKLRGLIARACDLGITHFDTSPLYGFGIAEKIIGGYIKNNLAFTVTTKIGQYPPGGTHDNLRMVRVRKLAGKFVKSLSRAEVNYSIKMAQASLMESSIRLKRECIDLLLIHNLDPNVMNTEEWVSWLSQIRNQGKVKHVGISAEPSHLGEYTNFTSMNSEIIEVLQGRYMGTNWASSEALSKKPDIFFGVLSNLESKQLRMEPVNYLKHVSRLESQAPIIVGVTKHYHLKQIQEISNDL